MIFEIKHYTHYKYQERVLFEPHSFRFRPREDPFQRILSFSILIDPAPAGSSQFFDLDGNSAHQAWFNETSKELKIIATSKVEVKNKNPFNYLVYPAKALRLPMEYTDEMDNLLKPYKAPVSDSLEVLKFAKAMTKKTNQQTISFLTHLACEISQEFLKEYRDQGGPKPPDSTLAEKKGACRDLAVLFMSACRMLGLAARFVSGYYLDVLDYQKHYLHSWVEVYIPGGGWRGFDPSSGLAVAERHVVVAACAIPSLCAPVTGIYLGNSKSSLTTEIEITTH